MTVEPQIRPPAAPAQDRPAVPLGQIFDHLFGSDAPIRFEAYDGSRGGNPDAALVIRLVRPRALSYLVTAPCSQSGLLTARRRLIQHRPKYTEVPYSIDKLSEIDRLDDVCIDAQPVAL